MSTICKPCNSEVKNRDNGIICDYCDCWFHAGCTGLSASNYKHFKALGENSFWFCAADKEKVANFIKNHKVEEGSIAEMKSTIDEIKTEVLRISGTLKTSKNSFADVLKMNNTQPSNSKVTFSRNTASKGIIVVPKCPNLTTSGDVEKMVKSKVDLVGIKTGVSKLKHIKNSGIFLATASNVDQLETEVRQKLGDDFKVYKPKTPTPQLIISGISREYKDDELWQEIKQTNPGFVEEDSLKVIHHRKKSNIARKTESWYYIVEVPPNTYKKMVDRYLSLDFKDHFVRQYVDATRCYNCQQYNHKSTNCQSTPVCARCGRNHKTTDCVKNVSYSCVNCKDANLRGSRFNTNHSCGSSQCKVHQGILNARQSRTNLNDFLSCQ